MTHPKLEEIRKRAEAATPEKFADRFLAWPLPASVCADTCASWPNYAHPRSGTNLLTASEAKEMLQHVAGYVLHDIPLLLDELDATRAERDELKARKCSHGPYEMYGTDGCERCEYGRVEMYRLNRLCLSCRALSPDSEASK